MQERYQVTATLGESVSGPVYLCQDLRLEGKTWAVKQLRNQQGADEFEQQAQLLASIHHRALPMIADHFVQDGESYLVIEYVDGVELAKRVLTEGPVSVEQALRWGMQIAEALEVLESQQTPLQLRNLGPREVLITEDQSVRLVNVGLSALQTRPRLESERGDCGFAAPELWEGEGDARADVYSLGALIYFALTGTVPAYEQPERPDSLSDDEWSVLARCLEHDPERRGHASQVKVSLQDLLDRVKPRSERPRPTAEAAVKPTATGEPPRRVSTFRRPASSAGWLPALLFVSSLIFILGLGGGLLSNLSERGSPEQGLSLKQRAQVALEKGDSVRAQGLLEAHLAAKPEDAEARILRQNLSALESEGAVTIPVITSLTGGSSDGIAMLPGLALAQSQLSETLPIVLELSDDGSQVARMVELTEKLAAGPAVIAIGPWTSQNLLAAAPVINKARLPLIAPAANDPRVWEAGPYIYSAAGHARPKASRLVQNFQKRGCTRAAVLFNADSVVSRSMAQIFGELFAQAGGSVVCEHQYLSTDRYLVKALSKIRREQADCILLCDWRDETVAGFAHQLKEEGLELPLAVMTVSSKEDLLQIGGEDIEGLVTTTYLDPTAPATGEFQKAFSDLFGGRRPEEWDANSYDTLMLVARALQSGVDREGMQRYLAEAGPDYEGVAGLLKHGRRSDTVPVLLEISDGRFRPVQ